MGGVEVQSLSASLYGPLEANETPSFKEMIHSKGHFRKGGRLGTVQTAPLQHTRESCLPAMDMKSPGEMPRRS